MLKCATREGVAAVTTSIKILSMHGHERWMVGEWGVVDGQASLGSINKCHSEHIDSMVGSVGYFAFPSGTTLFKAFII